MANQKNSKNRKKYSKIGSKYKTINVFAFNKNFKEEYTNLLLAEF